MVFANKITNFCKKMRILGKTKYSQSADIKKLVGYEKESYALYNVQLVAVLCYQVLLM